MLKIALLMLLFFHANVGAQEVGTFDHNLAATLKSLARTFVETPAMLVRYYIKQEMTKQDVISQIEHLDKRQVEEMIEAIPDKVIVSQVRNYFNCLAQRAKDQKFLQQIDSFWKQIMQKA